MPNRPVSRTEAAAATEGQDIGFDFEEPSSQSKGSIGSEGLGISAMPQVPARPIRRSTPEVPARPSIPPRPSKKGQEDTNSTSVSPEDVVRPVPVVPQRPAAKGQSRPSVPARPGSSASEDTSSEDTGSSASAVGREYTTSLPAVPSRPVKRPTTSGSSNSESSTTGSTPSIPSRPSRGDDFSDFQLSETKEVVTPIAEKPSSPLLSSDGQPMYPQESRKLGPSIAEGNPSVGGDHVEPEPTPVVPPRPADGVEKTPPDEPKTASMGSVQTKEERTPPADTQDEPKTTSVESMQAPDPKTASVESAEESEIPAQEEPIQQESEVAPVVVDTPDEPKTASIESVPGDSEITPVVADTQDEPKVTSVDSVQTEKEVKAPQPDSQDEPIQGESEVTPVVGDTHDQPKTASDESMQEESEVTPVLSNKDEEAMPTSKESSESKDEPGISPVVAPKPVSTEKESTIGSTESSRDLEISKDASPIASDTKDGAHASEPIPKESTEPIPPVDVQEDSEKTSIEPPKPSDALNKSTAVDVDSGPTTDNQPLEPKVATTPPTDMDVDKSAETTETKTTPTIPSRPSKTSADSQPTSIPSIPARPSKSRESKTDSEAEGIASKEPSTDADPKSSPVVPPRPTSRGIGRAGSIESIGSDTDGRQSAEPELVEQLPSKTVVDDDDDDIQEVKVVSKSTPEVPARPTAKGESKPAPPPKPKKLPINSKVGALRASLFNDLNQVISAGGRRPPAVLAKDHDASAEAEAKTEKNEESTTTEEQPKAPASSGRRRTKGPQRRLPTAAKSEWSTVVNDVWSLYIPPSETIGIVTDAKEEPEPEVLMHETDQEAEPSIQKTDPEDVESPSSSNYSLANEPTCPDSKNEPDPPMEIDTAHRDVPAVTADPNSGYANTITTTTTTTQEELQQPDQEKQDKDLHDDPVSDHSVL